MCLALTHNNWWLWCKLSSDNVGSSHQYLLSALLKHFLALSTAATVTGHSQPSISKFLYVAMKGACVQSVLTLPPCVAQSSAFQIELYTPIAWSLGNGIPLFSMLVCTLIGVSSTRNLKQNQQNRRDRRFSRDKNTNSNKSYLDN